MAMQLVRISAARFTKRIKVIQTRRRPGRVGSGHTQTRQLPVCLHHVGNVLPTRHRAACSCQVFAGVTWVSLVEVHLLRASLLSDPAHNSTAKHLQARRNNRHLLVFFSPPPLDGLAVLATRNLTAQPFLTCDSPVNLLSDQSMPE